MGGYSKFTCESAGTIKINIVVNAGKHEGVFPAIILLSKNVEQVRANIIAASQALNEIISSITKA